MLLLLLLLSLCSPSVCKYFLDAIENSQYGWFWECPSGVECHYRHCLPAGYVLKTKAEKERAKQQIDDDDEEVRAVLASLLQFVRRDARCRISVLTRSLLRVALPCVPFLCAIWLSSIQTLEEKIDQQRKALDLSKCTPITLELFKKWKLDKVRFLERSGELLASAAVHRDSSRCSHSRAPSLTSSRTRCAVPPVCRRQNVLMK